MVISGSRPSASFGRKSGSQRVTVSSSPDRAPFELRERGYGDDWLRQRGKAEDRVFAHRSAGLAIHEARRGLIGDLAVARDQYDCPDYAPTGQCPINGGVDAGAKIAIHKRGDQTGILQTKNRLIPYSPPELKDA